MIEAPVFMSTTGKEMDEVKNKIRTWLSEENFVEKSVDSANTSWHFECKMDGRMPFAVYQSVLSTNRIVISATVALNEHNKKNLDSLVNKARSEFLWDLQFSMIQTGCFFGPSPSIEKLQTATFYKHIYYDGLSKQALMDAIYAVFRCWVLFGWKLGRLGKVMAADMEDGYSMHYM